MTKTLSALDMARLILFAAVPISMLMTGCSSKLLTSQDYEESLYHHRSGSPEKALEAFPQGEEKTFITTLERAYLKLLTGQPDNVSLRKLVDSIEQRIRYEGSREVESLFYAETPEGYYASEHEIIWLHLLLSWGYSLNKDYEKGCVEARKASHLLSAPWSHEGHFDDAMLRIVLGGLWTLCGSWEDALVDFRKAYQLSPDTTWLKDLIALETAPRNLFMIWGGAGPRPYWDPNAKLNVLRGFRHVGFRPQGQKSELTLLDHNGNPIIMHLSPDSSSWYQRHFERDNAIHELILDSHYTGRAAGTVTVESAKMAASYVAGTALIVGSVVVGGVLIYIGIQVGSDGGGYIGGAGVSIAILGVKAGLSLMTETTEESLETIKKDLNPSDSYRFVRFLPEYVWVGWNQSELDTDKPVIAKNQQTLIHPRWMANGTRSFVSFFPDADLKSNPESSTLISWKAWQKQAEAYLSGSSGPVTWEKLTQAVNRSLEEKQAIALEFAFYIGDERHSFQVNPQKITGAVGDRWFKEYPTYEINLAQKELSSARDAMKHLIEIPPSQFFFELYQKLDSSESE